MEPVDRSLARAAPERGSVEQQDQEEQAKLDWLRGAATEAFASLDRGEGTRFDSIEALDAYVTEVGEEVIAECLQHP
jgi:antitoxin ParD1/3/4